MPKTTKTRPPTLEVLALFKFEYTGEEKKAIESARSQIVSDLNEYWQGQDEECLMTNLTVRMPTKVMLRLDAIQTICQSWNGKNVDYVDTGDLINDLSTIYSICGNIKLEDIGDIRE